MRILSVNHTLDPIHGGGTAERVFKMSQELINRGIECTILTMTTGEKQRNLVGGRIVVLPLLNKRFFIPKFLFKGIFTEVRRADVIHIMGHWTLLNVLVWIAVKIMKKPYVHCPAGALEIVGRSKIIKNLYNVIVGKRIVKEADHCIAITSSERKAFYDYGVYDKRISIIPNAVSAPDVSDSGSSFSSKLANADRRFVLYLGRLSYIKGVDLLVDAFCSLIEEIKEFDLVIAGPDDGLLSQLKDKVNHSKAQDRIHFVGYVGGVEKFEAYKNASILVIPSRREAMSLVVLEAGVMGTPSVFTDQCGLESFAAAGCGWMIPATVDGIRQGLISALSSPDDIKIKGESAKQIVLSKYSWDAIADMYTRLFQSLVR
ncbi:glycosyltransferase [Bdellovibrio bacteriovorus]|uniref:glycosyltransferase n=1 Tax=Bdellovibrio bacteriovorus TaxID=959 RepID=UPI0035A7409B